MAVLLVVCYHNFGFVNQFHFGWLGVDLFFVLSGFLITGVLLNDLGKPNYFSNFYTRRVLRIFPLYYGTLIFFLLIYPHISSQPNLNYYTNNQTWLWTHLQNWLYIFQPTNSNNLLHHFWSLAVEEQFYFVWPLTIVIVKKPKTLLLLLLAALLLVIGLRFMLWVYKIDNLSYYNLYTFSRIDGICLGSMLAILRKNNQFFIHKKTSLLVLTLAAFNFIFYFLNGLYNYSFPYLAIVGYTTFAMLFVLLVNEALEDNNRVVQFLFCNPILRFFGRISYGFYVFHWPVYVLLKPSFDSCIKYFGISEPHPIIYSSIATLIGTIISWISFNYFERHFIKRKIAFQN